MSETDSIFNINVDDTANFKQDNRRLVGHLVELTVGGEALTPDFNFLNPANPSEKVPLVGIITYLQWDKKPGGVLFLEGRVSSANQGILQDAIDSKDKTAECELKFNIYKYDVKTKTYYPCCHTDDKAIKGQLSHNDISTVSDELATEYRQIANHKFTLAILGSDEQDELLHICYTPDRKKTFQFGQKCAAG